ncbi:hypothetical protein HHL19_13990 [Streptomyces sp. R302]|uniref:DUF7683 domain-containing protein n=1 Tax=unclassified Streptomyces TaxID=2593676 RepID=UPI00145D0896|nr:MULTISPECIES: hypothetical protein [unclassified Streptomyces]NML51183.1 hypothetical protein [Streptomyces sp. R301]NML79761.1 hypothetical protein [Streptomyces sp. R302]
MTTEHPPNTIWFLEGFSKEDDFLRTQHPISAEQIITLREVIVPDEDDPWMIYGYNVPLSVWPTVDAILHCGPPDPTLDYQTCAYADE